jgi:hypothetical protein
MKHLAPACFALAGAVSAQVTITDGNVVYTQGNPSPLQTEAAIVSADFRQNGPSSPNHTHQHWWFYRVAGDTREYPFRDDGSWSRFSTPTEITNMWTNVDGRGFLAGMRSAVFSTGPTSGYVTNRMAIDNISPTPISIEVFCYADLNVCGATVNTGTLTPGAHTGLASSACGSLVDFRGVVPVHHEGSAVGPLKASLLDTSLTTLADNAGPFGPADYCAAFQWTLNLQPGGAATCTTWITADYELSVLPSYSTFGTEGPGTNNVYPRIRRVGNGVQRNTQSSVRFELSQALPNSSGLFLLSLGRGAFVLAGIDIHVDLGLATSALVLTDPIGGAFQNVTIPFRPNFTGVPLVTQFVVLDSGAPNGFASWTIGNEMILGHQ